MSFDAGLARDALFPNFVAPFEYFRAYNEPLSKDGPRAARQFPWSEKLLYSPCPFFPEKIIADTHAAVYLVATIHGNPLTPMELISLHRKSAATDPFFRLPLSCGMAQHPLLGKPARQGWHLLLRHVVPASHAKSYAEQRSILPHGYRPAPLLAVQTAYAVIRTLTGEQLFHDRYGRCSDRVTYERQRCHAIAGYGRRGGFDTGVCPDSGASNWLGIFAERMPPKRKTGAQRRRSTRS